MQSVMIIGSPSDQQVKRVANEVSSGGGRAGIVDSAAFPERTQLALEAGRLHVTGKSARDPAAVYLRGFHALAQSKEFERDLETRPRGLMAQIDEKMAFLNSLVLSLDSRGVPVMNGPWINAQHSNKPYQLELLSRAGLKVPAWIATNDPKSVRAFVAKHKNVVYKPLAGGATVRAVEKVDLSRERLAALAYAPVLFQKRIEGISVRAYVVGRKVVAAAELHSTELDYRRGEDAVVATKLTPEERRMVLAAARACGMRFSGVDLIRGARASYVLECNPSPMFAVFEEKTGLDVAGPFAKYLIKGCR